MPGYPGKLRVVPRARVQARHVPGRRIPVASLTPAEQALVIGWAVVKLAVNGTALGALIGVAVVYEGACMVGRAAVRALEDT